jgi:PAS domain S-box-containing protein
LRSFLEAPGYRIIEAANGDEGLAAYDRERPDIVLADIDMRTMSGTRFVPQLQEKYIRLPVIVFSGKESLPDALEAVRRGAWDHLLTPINEEELELSIQRALEWSRLLSEIIHYRDQTEIKLQESEERFSQIFLQHEDAIILFNFDTFAIIDANPAATDLFGYSRSELLGGFPWPFAGDNHAELRESLQAALGENNRFDIFRITQFQKNGPPVVVSMRGKLVTLMDTTVVYCSIRDITRKIMLEDEVRNTQAKLIQVNEMASLGMLASGIAHEINNPNNFIMFNSTLLAESWYEVLEVLEETAAERGDFYLGGRRYSEVREEIPRLIDGLTEGARRIHDIIETMKTAVRQEPDGFEAQVDVNKIVQMAMTLLSHEIRKHGNNITVELCNDLPHVRGKAQLIEQVIINLVNNALNAVSGNGGGIRIATSHEPSDGVVTITVRDEGIGMTSEVLERISEPFFTTRFDSGGTGLGVSISLSIIKEHNGTLTYDSKPGSGTTATVRLPVTDCRGNQGSLVEETA